MKAIIHRIVAIPFIYNLVQNILGERKAHDLIRKEIACVKTLDKVLDIGGGTGLSRQLLPAKTWYVCLDVDPQKLHGFRKQFPAEAALLGDATQSALQSNSFDAIVCVSVSHHLHDNQLPALFDECKRILKPDGQLIFWDAVWDTRKLTGQALWSLDRGAYPHTEKLLRDLIAARFSISAWQNPSIWHNYVLCRAIRN